MLYKGSTKIGSFQLGSTKIGKLYKGSTLVYSSSVYKPDEIIFESSTAGTYNVELLETGKYEVYCIAGGGGCSAYDDYRGREGGGGSGSGFIGIIRINKGTYSIKVGPGGARGTNGGDGTGGANSYIGELLIAYGGGGGFIRSSVHAGAGGAAPTISATIISTQLNAAGNSGNVAGYAYASGGVAVYLTYGAGGGSNSNGKAGYIKIVYKGK